MPRSSARKRQECQTPPTQRTAQVLLGCWPAGNACASPRAVETRLRDVADGVVVNAVVLEMPVGGEPGRPHPGAPVEDAHVRVPAADAQQRAIPLLHVRLVVSACQVAVPGAQERHHRDPHDRLALDRLHHPVDPRRVADPAVVRVVDVLRPHRDDPAAVVTGGDALLRDRRRIRVALEGLHDRARALDLDIGLLHADLRELGG